jgi:hypothetical protein
MKINISKSIIVSKMINHPDIVNNIPLNIKVSEQSEEINGY